MVQAAGVNALLALVGAAPAANSAGSTLLGSVDGSDANAAGQSFSQLLSDSGLQYDDQQAPAQSWLLQGKLDMPGGLGALSAQEVPATPAEMLADLLQAREQSVTKETADTAVQQLNAMAQQYKAPAEAQAITEIKQQLVAIQQGGTPKTVAEILQGAPSLKQAKLPIADLTAMLAQKKLPDAANTAQMEEAPETVATQFIPAAMFRSARADHAKTAPKKDTQSSSQDDADHDLVAALTVPTIDTTDQANAAATVTIIEPLAVNFTLSAPIATGTITQSADTTPITAAPARRMDIDAIIPPLTQSLGEDDDQLPAVTLPKLANDAADTDKMDELAGSFESLAVSAAKADKADANLKDSSNTTITALLNPSHNGGLSPTQTINAAQPVNLVPTHNYMNHAPVTDQVHVAIKQAAKDGIEKITIQLDPIDLGRVEVHMHKNSDGETQISFTVDKPETFDGLSRDARVLERSLQEAGIKADTGSMQFNLRQQPQPQAQLNSNLGGNQQQPQQHADAGDNSAADGTTTSVASIDATTTRNYILNVREGVDISA